MIETLSDCERFFAENKEGDWIVHAVPVEDGVHPSNNTLSILFIRNISTGKTYYYAPNHPDSIPKVSTRIFLQAWFKHSKNTKWALDGKALRQLTGLPDVKDANLCGFFRNNEILELNEFETPAHNLIKQNSNGVGQVNKAIPLMKHKEAFDNLCADVSAMIHNFEIDEPYIRFNDLILQTLGKVESNGIYVDAPVFEKYFGRKPNANGFVFSQYNVYTSTGRPSNRYGGINYAALNLKDGSRSSFVSRYGKDGRMVVVDYTAFHPRIIAYLTKYHTPVETDIYEYLAKLYFHKNKVDETDIKEAKNLTFRQLYGGVEDKYIHIKYLAHLKSYIDSQWAFFQNNGYVLTPFFKRKITKHHILEPNPPKVFNYILQAAEGEISIPKIKSVNDYLQSKKTRAVLYTYDAVLYDFHKNDGIETLNEIRKIMSFDGVFPMKTYIGNSYHDIRLMNI